MGLSLAALFAPSANLSGPGLPFAGTTSELTSEGGFFSLFSEQLAGQQSLLTDRKQALITGANPDTDSPEVAKRGSLPLLLSQSPSATPPDESATRTTESPDALLNFFDRLQTRTPAQVGLPFPGSTTLNGEASALREGKTKREAETESGDGALEANTLGALLLTAPLQPVSRAADQSETNSDFDALGDGRGRNLAPWQPMPSTASGTAAEAASTSGSAAKIADGLSFSDALTVKLEANNPVFGASGSPTAPQHTSLPQTTAASDSPLATPLGHQNWNHEFGDKVVWMAHHQTQSAEISINPPELGPIKINLVLEGDKASASFASPHPEVRQAIESAMPQLKEMLSSAGIDLGQANVGANLAQHQQQAQEQQRQRANGGRERNENAILSATNDQPIATSTMTSNNSRSGAGMVDLFA